MDAFFLDVVHGVGCWLFVVCPFFLLVSFGKCRCLEGSSSVVTVLLKNGECHKKSREAFFVFCFLVVGHDGWCCSVYGTSAG